MSASPPMRHAYPVVVVGGGPAGLITAITLAAHGIEVLLVERRTGVPARPRATVLSLRTMELLRSWELEDAILAGSDDVDMAMLETPSLAQAGQGRRIDVGYPSRAQSQILSPTAAACVAQDHLETVLLAHLASLPTARVAFGVQVQRVAATGHDSTVTLLDRSSGRLRTVSAGYVVAADGAHSRIRASLGLRMIGPDSLFGGPIAEVRAPLWELLGDHRYLLYWLSDPAHGGTLLPAGQGDRWLFGFEPDLGSDPTPSPEVVRRRLRLATGAPDLPIRVERVGRFSSGAQIVERFRVGNIFLAGDSAHRITPRGGTGLNTAISDGRDLGWKLLWVLKGWAPESLLATYEGERRPQVAHNVARSADPLGSRRGADTEVPVDLGGRISHVWTRDLTSQSRDARRSTLDLVGAGLTLFTGTDAKAWRRGAGELSSMSATPPLSVVPLEHATARALGIGPSGALLVRPDAIATASWRRSAAPEHDLRRAVTTLVEGNTSDASETPRSAA